VTLTITVGNYWIAAVAVGSTQYRQVTSTAVSANTYYILEYTVNAAGTSTAFSINGSSVGTIAQAPTAAVGPVIMMYNTAYTSGSPICKFDYFNYEYYFTTPR
jgi:hypothetical protein